MKQRIFIAFVLLCCGVAINTAFGADPSFGAYRWRYSSPRSDPGSFYVGVDIKLEFISDAAGVKQDDSNIKWIIPAICYAEQSLNTSGGNVVVAQKRSLVVNCRQSGSFLFQVGLVGSDVMDGFYITVNIKQACYKWALSTTYANATSPLQPQVHNQVRIWIIDPIIATSDEINGNAIVPNSTSSSQSITRQLQRLGEAPIISVKDASHSLDISKFPNKIEFNDTGLYWYFDYTPLQANSIHIEIASEGANFLGCHVEPTSFILNVQVPIHNLSSISTNTWNAPVAPSNYKIRYDPCSTNLATLIIPDNTCSKSFIMTTDQFETAQYVTPPSMQYCLQDLYPRRSGHFVFLDSAGIVHQTSDFKLFTPFTNDNKELPKVTNIKSNDACDSIYESDEILESPLNNVLFAWNKVMDADSFHVLSDKNATYTTVKLHEKYLIHDITLQISLPFYTLLVSDKQSHSFLIQYNYKLGQWSPLLRYEFPAKKIVKDDNNIIKSTRSTSAEAFIYGNSMFYSPDGGYSAFEMDIISRVSGNTGLNEGESIIEVQTSTNGKFWALTSTNRLFAGTVTSRTMIEIQSGTSGNYPMFIFWRTDGMLLSINPPNPASDDAYSYIIPYSNEITSPRVPLASNPTLQCPYKSWLDNITTLVYTADYLDHISSQIVMTYTGEYAVSTSFLTSQANITNVRTESSAIPFGSYMLATTNLTIQNNFEYVSNVTNPSISGAEARTDVRITSSIGSLVCPIHQKVMQVKWGCPLYKSIRVTDLSYNPDDCPEWEGVSISGRVKLNDKPRKPMSFASSFKSYNVSAFGCPIRRKNTQSPFLLNLSLMENGVDMGPVKVNYVVYEINGRSDYSYNLTEASVGCKVRQYGWAERLMNEASPDYAWTSKNTMNCFAYNSSMEHPNDSPYEILNATSKNAISFTKAEGLFIFQVRIVEPSYSFCDLTTYVAFDIHPRPKQVPVTMIVIFVVIAIFLIVLATSYSMFRKKKRH